MNVVAALCATTILGALAVFQLALAFGAPAGRFAWGGRHRVLPTGLRVGSGLSILLYAGLAAVLLARAGALAVPGDAPPVIAAAWAVFGYFVLGVLVNAISRSRPERFTMTPVSGVLAVCALIVALG